jgi:hypothetical protein
LETGTSTGGNSCDSGFHRCNVSMVIQWHWYIRGTRGCYARIIATDFEFDETGNFGQVFRVNDTTMKKKNNILLITPFITVAFTQKGF